MAKYSLDLFDEIVDEMIKDKRSVMEMMAELDVEQEAIFEAQERLAKRS
jgi:predicted ester cyclase